jgi:hypothetical protein
MAKAKEDKSRRRAALPHIQAAVAAVYAMYGKPPHQAVRPEVWGKLLDAMEEAVNATLGRTHKVFSSK